MPTCLLFFALESHRFITGSGLNVCMDISAFLTVSRLIKMVCSMLIFKLVFNLFIVEKQSSQVAVHGDKAIVISTKSRMELRSLGFEDNELAYISTGYSVLCTSR